MSALRVKRTLGPVATGSPDQLICDHLNLTTSTISSWHLGHSNVRLSWFGFSGSIEASHIGAPQLAHLGGAICCGWGIN